MGYLICDKCKGYYELQPGESPEDFSDICDCGGKLEFKKTPYMKTHKEKPYYGGGNITIVKSLLSHKNWLLLIFIPGVIINLGILYLQHLGVIKGFPVIYAMGIVSLIYIYLAEIILRKKINVLN